MANWYWHLSLTIGNSHGEDRCIKPNLDSDSSWARISINRTCCSSWYGASSYASTRFHAAASAPACLPLRTSCAKHLSYVGPHAGSENPYVHSHDATIPHTLGWYAILENHLVRLHHEICSQRYWSSCCGILQKFSAPGAKSISEVCPRYWLKILHRSGTSPEKNTL